MSNQCKRRCENCLWWADFEPRVFAVISEVHGSTHATDRIELRFCRFRPHPGISARVGLYTDANYACGEWQSNKKDLP